MVCDDGLGNGCPDSVDLCGDTSTLYSDADIEVGELVLSEDQDWFEYLQSHNLGLDVLDRLAIDLNETPSLFSERDSGGRLFPGKAKRSGKKKSQTTSFRTSFITQKPSLWDFILWRSVSFRTT